MSQQTTLLYASLIALSACQPVDPEAGLSNRDKKENAPSAPQTFLVPNGKILGASVMEEVYQYSPLDTFDFPLIDTRLVTALEDQLRLLQLRRQKRNQQIGNLRINIEQLRATILILKKLQQTKPLHIEKYLEAYQIWGNDRRGNVKFTGYYIPLIKVSKNRTGKYIYPIYDRPRNWEGPLPTRQEIEGQGVLDSLDLELAYAASKVDIYYMQVQGSGYVEYLNGQRELFAYNGTNRHPYHSIEKFIVSRDDISPDNLSIDGIKRFLTENSHLADTVLFSNPSYTFFTPRNSPPKGAGQVPLTQNISIAVDDRYIPLGSCLLAAVPVYDRRKKKVTHHRYRILLAQDVGGAINGSGHIDYYSGVGRKAQRQAEKINHYGQLWLLLPKRSEIPWVSN